MSRRVSVGVANVSAVRCNAAGILGEESTYYLYSVSRLLREKGQIKNHKKKKGRKEKRKKKKEKEGK